MIDDLARGHAPLAAETLTCAGVTAEAKVLTLSRMGTGWPVEEFVAYLRRLMDAAGISDYAELSRLSGVSQNQFSNWRRGLSQPSRESLNRIAPVLPVAPVKLWLAAGLVSADELDMAETPDLRVLPAVVSELVELFEHPDLSPEGRDFMIRSLQAFIAGFRAEWLGRSRPTGRRRAG